MTFLFKNNSEDDNLRTIEKMKKIADYGAVFHQLSRPYQKESRKENVFICLTWVVNGAHITKFDTSYKNGDCYTVHIWKINMK